jgi:hypothetical protein
MKQQEQRAQRKVAVTEADKDAKMQVEVARKNLRRMKQQEQRAQKKEAAAEAKRIKSEAETASVMSTNTTPIADKEKQAIPPPVSKKFQEQRMRDMSDAMNRYRKACLVCDRKCCPRDIGEYSIQDRLFDPIKVCCAVPKKRVEVIQREYSKYVKIFICRHPT